jgi:hypothetical protein
MEKPCFRITTSPRSTTGLYTRTTNVGNAGVWPALPLLVILSRGSSADEDDIIAVLGRSDRVRHIFFHYLINSLCEKVWAAMLAGAIPQPDISVVRVK